jgi:predicted RNA-binding Zn ribbon-like protein
LGTANGAGLASFEEIAGWAHEARLIDEQTAWELSRAVTARRVEGLTVLRRAKAFREAAHGILTALSERHTPPSAVLETLNRELGRAMENATLATYRGDLQWSWRAGEKALERILWPIVLAVADLLTSPDVKRVHKCASPTCGRLFLDTSKNGSKRWCDMKTCGNRAKVRLHRQRRADGLPPVRQARGAAGRPPKPTARQRRDDSFID